MTDHLPQSHPVTLLHNSSLLDRTAKRRYNASLMNHNALSDQARLLSPQTSTAPHLFSLLSLMLLVTVALLGTMQLSAQTSSDNNSPAAPTYSPLLLFTNTGGKIVPLHDGQMLKVGRRYRMAAVPNRGFAFTNWTLVYQHTFATVVIDQAGAQSTNFTTVLSPMPDYSSRRVLMFTNQAPEVIFDSPNLTVTGAIGWRPEFVPRPTHRSKTNVPQQ